MSYPLPAQDGNAYQRKGIVYSPHFQLSVLALFVFMSPCLWGVLANMVVFFADTARKASDLATADNASIVTYSITAFFGGMVVNSLGPRLSLLIGGLGFVLEIISMWTFKLCNQSPETGKFFIAAGAIQGICEGMLWSAQGAMMLAYPTENRKGLVIGIFWSIMSLTPLIEAAVNLSQINNLAGFRGPSYTVLFPCFFVLTFVGALVALLVVSPTRVFRTDGTRVLVPRSSPWKAALQSVYTVLKTDPKVLLLFPMFFTSGYFYEWQQINYNFLLFDPPTSALNNLVFVVAEMVGSLFLGFVILDRSRLSRRARAYSAMAIVFLIALIVHARAYIFGKWSDLSGTPQLDSTDSAYPAYAVLYIFCGIMDGMWNTLIYWLLGAISNNILKLAVLVGFYIGLQSASSVTAARVEIFYQWSFTGNLIPSWILCAVSVVVALPAIVRIRDNSDSDDQEFESKLY